MPQPLFIQPALMLVAVSLQQVEVSMDSLGEKNPKPTPKHLEDNIHVTKLSDVL